MRLFITGATGFICSHVVRLGLARGHEVRCLTRRKAEPSSTHPTARSQVTTLCKPLADLTPTDLHDIDGVLHFSAHGVSPKTTTWIDAFRHNVVDQLHLLETIRAAGIKHTVLCGSCVEYGAAGERYDFIPPTAPLEPRGAYAVSKAVGCTSATCFARDAGLPLTYLRVFHAFGEGQHGSNFWPSLRAAALAGKDFPMTAGEQVRDFIDVTTVAEIFLRVIAAPPPSASEPQVHNVGSGVPVSLLDFAGRWWAAWGATGRIIAGAIPYRPDEVMRYVPEVTL
jgi:nucleoside-diphosphate-sugar epimerase